MLIRDGESTEEKDKDEQQTTTMRHDADDKQVVSQLLPLEKMKMDSAAAEECCGDEAATNCSPDRAETGMTDSVSAGSELGGGPAGGGRGNRPDDSLQSLCSRILDNIRDVEDYGQQCFAKFGTADQDAVASATKELRLRLARCQESVHAMADHTAQLLEAQDAEIGHLQEELRLAKESRGAAVKPKVPPVTLAAAATLPDELKDPTAINDQLDTLMDRVRVLLNSGSLTHREAQEVAAGGGGALLTSADSVDLKSPMAALAEGGSAEATSSAVPDLKASEAALNALKQQADRIKEELVGYRKAVRQSADQLDDAAHHHRDDEDDHDGGGGYSEGVESGSVSRRKVSLEEAKMKAGFFEEMQRGTWFFRVSRKYGAIGRAFKSTSVKRCFLRIADDFKHLHCSASDAFNRTSSSVVGDHNEEKRGRTSVGGHGNKEPTVVVPLDNVIGFVYGSESRAYKMQEGSRGRYQPSHLCLSLWTKRQALDLISLSERDVYRWYLGLNSLLPFFPGRQILTPQEFKDMKEAMKVESFGKETSRTSDESDDDDDHDSFLSRQDESQVF